MQSKKTNTSGGGLLAKLATAVATLALVLSSVMTPVAAYAANAYNMQITDAPVGRTYEGYQIFKGTPGGTNGNTLSNVEWGDDISAKSSDFLAALQGDSRFNNADRNNIFADATTAADVADALGTASNGRFDDAYAKAFADVAGAFTTSNDTSAYTYLDGKPTVTFTDKNDGTYTAQNVPGGFYLIGDKLGSVKDNEYVTRYITQVSGANNGTISIKAKVDVPENKKEIVNNGEPVKFQDAGVGDTVSYRLTGSIPTNIANYKTYAYKFVDTMSKGLTLDQNSIVVKIGTDPATATKVDASSYVVTTDDVTEGDYNGGHKLTVSFTDLKTATANGGTIALAGGMNVYVEYNVTVNKDAVVTNPNESHIEFSNNPNGDGKGETPDDTTYVFTYESDVSKKDKDNKDALAGAKFFLTRVKDGQKQGAKLAKTENADGATMYKVTEWINWPANTNNEADWSTRDGNALTKEEQAAINAGITLIEAPTDGTGKGKFNILGLDTNVEYTLHEAITPDGYNRLTTDPTFTITSSVSQDSQTKKYKIDWVKVNDADNSGSTSTDGTGTSITAKVDMDVLNGKGSGLPSTGGAGTVAFTVIGLGLMAAAGIAFARTRRQDAANA